MKFLMIVVYFIFFLPQVYVAQQLVYSDICHCGVTGNGGSAAFGAGTVNMPVQIPPNSSIKKAFLITARDSLADNITVTLNSVGYTFSDATIVTNGFNSITNQFGSRYNSSIHLIDITSDIDSSINIYNLFIPPQPNGLKGAYLQFYIYILFSNNSLPIISSNLFLNNQNVAPITNYNLNNLSSINNNNNNPVCLTLSTGHFCDTIQDGSFVNVNNNTIGLLGGDDLNSNLWTCVSTWSNFAHYNDSLFSLDDDIADSTMKGTDALADIKSYVNNGDTAVDVVFTYQSNFKPLSNPIRAVMLSYSTPCDTFSTTATSLQDTICLDDSVQLSATGGVQYSWFGAFGGLSDTSSANPIASPPQTTTYIVTIKNDSGCVKTEHVKIWVSPEPIPDTIVVTNNVCGDSIGSITVGNISNGNPPYSYTLTNLQTTNSYTQTTNTFNNLGTGIYEIQVSNANGCQWRDTVTITETNNAAANFTANPQSGVAPLDVTFNNISTGANNFEWTVINSNGDTLAQHSTINTQHFFTEGGTYEVCLIAYNNQPQCADTVCKTIFIDANEEISLFIPNVFTPNGDNENDNFVIQLIGAEYLESLEVQVFNRWGQKVTSSRFDVQSFGETSASAGMTELVIWNGTTTAGNKASEGTYFYVVSYTTKLGETVVEKGTVSLLS